MKNKISRHATATLLLLFLAACLLLLPAAASNVLAVSFSRAKNFPVGFIAYEVAVADFNGDGKSDLVVWSSVDNKISILLGDGNGAVGPAKKFAVGTYPFSVAVGDFNEDGIPDLALANGTSHSVSILLGNGDGTFGPATNFAIGGFAGSVVVGDFNRDGRLDLAVTSGIAGVSVLPGDGTGSFGPAANFPAEGFSMVVGDFDGDGILDLAMVSDSSNAVSILLGNGDGTFGAAIDFPVGGSPTSVAVGDFNGDGNLDLAVTNSFKHKGKVSIFLGAGDGSFGTAKTFAAGYLADSVVVADFNGDGKPDLAMITLRISNGLPAVRLSILLGVGDGTFSAAKNFSVGGGPITVAAGDFNADGKPDLAMTILGSKVSILLNTTP